MQATNFAALVKNENDIPRYFPEVFNSSEMSDRKKTSDCRNINNNHSRQNDVNQQGLPFPDAIAQLSNLSSLSSCRLQAARSPEHSPSSNQFHYSQHHYKDGRKSKERVIGNLSQMDLISHNQKALAAAILNHKSTSVGGVHHLQHASHKQTVQKRSLENNSSHHQSTSHFFNNEHKSPQSQCHKTQTTKKMSHQTSNSFHSKNKPNFHQESRNSLVVQTIESEPSCNAKPWNDSENIQLKRRYSSSAIEKSEYGNTNRRLSSTENIKTIKLENCLSNARLDPMPPSKIQSSNKTDLPLNLSTSLGKPSFESKLEAFVSACNSKTKSDGSDKLLRIASCATDRSNTFSTSPKLLLTVHQNQDDSKVQTQQEKYSSLNCLVENKTSEKKPCSIDLSETFNLNFESQAQGLHFQEIKGENSSLLTFDGQTINTPDLLSKKTLSDSNSSFFPSTMTTSISPMVNTLYQFKQLRKQS